MNDDIAALIESGEFDYEQLAAMTGQVSTAVATHKSAFRTAGFQAEDVYLYDKQEYEVAPKSIRIMGGEDQVVFLDKDLSMTILGRYYMFRRWDNDAKKYAATSEIAPEFRNIELRDDAGGINAGRLPRFVTEEDMKQMEALEPEKAAMHKNAKTFRVVYALVSGKGKNLKGEEVTVENLACRFSFGTSVREEVDNIINLFTNNKTLTFQYVTKVTLKKSRAGAQTIARPEFTQNFKTPASMSVVGPALKEMMEDVKAHNQYVVDKYDAFQKTSGQDDAVADDHEFTSVGKNDLDDEIPF